MITKEQIVADYQTIQDEICAGLERVDGKSRFVEEKWSGKVAVAGVPALYKTAMFLKKAGLIFRLCMAIYRL